MSLRLRDWLDTRTLPLPGGSDRTADLVAAEEVAILRSRARHGEERKGKFNVVAGLVYLQGRCPQDVLDMTFPDGASTRHAPVVWNVADDRASQTLEAIAARQLLKMVMQDAAACVRVAGVGAGVVPGGKVLIGDHQTGELAVSHRVENAHGMVGRIAEAVADGRQGGFELARLEQVGTAWPEVARQKARDFRKFPFTPSSQGQAIRAPVATSHRQALFCSAHLATARRYTSAGELGAAHGSATAVARKLRRCR